MHFFAIRAKPTKAAANTADIIGADALIWVRDGDRTSAENDARAYVMSRGWIIEDVEYAQECTPGLIAQLDAIESANHA